MKLPITAQVSEMMADEKGMEVLIQLKRLVSTPESLEKAAESALEELVDDVILGACFDVHRAAKLGLTALEDGLVEDENKYQIVEGPDVDVFGQLPVKKQHECVCPSCHRNLAASRFAPHLEKCMGMGRNSSRIASRRIANNSKENASYGGGGTVSDDDDDADWTAGGSDRRRKRRDRHCGGSSGGGGRRTKTQKVRNGEVPPPTTSSTSTTSSTPAATTSSSKDGGGAGACTVPSTSVGATPSSEAALPSKGLFESMSDEDKRTLLTQICGVISEHTGKLCLRSMRCPLHTDEQRRAVRANLLGQQSFSGQVNKNSQEVEVSDCISMVVNRGSGAVVGLIGLNQAALTQRPGPQVDVEMLDGEVSITREPPVKGSWEIEHSNTSSPADSASTSSSSSNKKREKSSKTKKKNSSKGVKVSANVLLSNHQVGGD
ncbi:ataxin-7-like protein 3 [Ischnura elegans]|uniref:ataxin-7-like protein 3 n=1 Tax=Ischnura elegans TaxID=197161 RepID=UPI001ED8AA06|nr:ataxin-7-like protein 3 [Ischnura elegans]